VRAAVTAEVDGLSIAVTGGSDGKLRLWNLAEYVQIGEPLTGHANDVWAVATARLDGRPIVVSGGGDREIRIWDLARRVQIGQPLTGQSDAIWGIGVAELDGRLVILSGGDLDGSVHLCDLSGKGNNVSLVGHAGPVWSVATTKVGSEPTAVTGGADGIVRIWNLTTL